jgi:hypothetical protein
MNVPLMVARGYASISFLHSAAEVIEAKGKPAYIFHFGDLDPSGVDAARDIEAKLRRYAPDAEIHFERPAVTREQAQNGIWSRPTKMTYTRAELRAPQSNWMRYRRANSELVRTCIERHVDKEQLAVLRAAGVPNPDASVGQDRKRGRRDDIQQGNTNSTTRPNGYAGQIACCR